MDAARLAAAITQAKSAELHQMKEEAAQAITAHIDALKAENARLRAELDDVDYALEGLAQSKRGHRICAWIGEAADATTRASELEARLQALCDTAQAVVAYDGDDAKPPFVDLLLRLETEVARSRPAPAPAAEGEG